MATKTSPRAGTPRSKPPGLLPTSTSFYIIAFLCIFSFLSLFYLAHESTSSLHLRKSDTEDHLEEIERLVSKLEREVAKIEAKKGELDYGVNHDAAAIENEKEDVDAVLIAEPEPVSDHVFIDPDSEKWAAQLKTKLLCLRLRKGALYLYHVRKAAGTSLRDILHLISMSWRVHFYETEGVVLDHSIFDHQGVTSVLTLREPISRILSLYWYEHVGWFDGILKQTSKCKKLSEWVAAWKDGSQWKTDFITKNPGTVYVEIENYYVKMLIGWKDPTHKIDEKDFEEAKAILRQFDFVFLTDWMGDDTQIDAINSVFPGRSNVAMGHKIRGDHNARTRLSPTLAADEAAVKEELTKINNYDLQLFDYAQSLMAYRLKLIVPMVNEVKKELGINAHQNTLATKALFEQQKKHKECENLDFRINEQQRKNVGVIRPAGHKGPF